MNREQGFTLIEILVSLAIFAVVVVGALGILGAAGSGGFLEGFATGFMTTRAARDITAASVYLQAFQEHAASQTSSTLIPGSYCQGPDAGCANNLASAGLGTYPLPPGQPYQLEWRRLDITIERWYWDNATRQYRCADPPSASCNFVIPIPVPEYLVRIHSVLTWQTLEQKRRGVTPSCGSTTLQSGCIEAGRFLP